LFNLSNNTRRSNFFATEVKLCRQNRFEIVKIFPDGSVVISTQAMGKGTPERPQAVHVYMRMALPLYMFFESLV
jgi:hypothetical protein